MKLNEIMVGDWVYVENVHKPVRVTSVGYTVFANYEHFQEVDGSVYGIQPIPLTSEILTKNGFERIEGTGGDFLLKGFLYWSSFAKRIFIQGHPNQTDWIDVCKCQYVHELQHALKLYEIEKDIIL